MTKQGNAGAPSPGAAPGTGGTKSPGDEVPPGTPQSGEDVCPECGGSGEKAPGQRCANCSGSGRVTRLVGDA